MDITAGRWRARIVPLTQADAALDLRAQVMRRGDCDRDVFDTDASHLMIEDGTGIAACARMTVQRGRSILTGYTGQHYDLGPFAGHFDGALEVGRICIAPDCHTPEVPRLLLALLARVVMSERLSVLYGCASFPADGTGMAHLSRRIAPDDWRPGLKASETAPLANRPGPLPPLVRSYLSLGAAVSDHAVVDRDLGTSHVFAALPIASIQPARARLLTGLLDAA